jgi:hypothetical protein
VAAVGLGDDGRCRLERGVDAARGVVLDGLGLQREVVVADLDEVALAQLEALGNAFAVDLDAVEGVEVLDEDRSGVAHQPRVAAGDVPLHQADRVPLHPADGDLAPAQRNDRGLPFVVLDDELVKVSHEILGVD